MVLRRHAPPPGAPAVALAAGPILAASTDLQQISPLVWVMIAISFGGSLITFAILVYALWKYRDPATKGRTYG